jgi:hypothetical protein
VNGSQTTRHWSPTPKRRAIDLGDTPSPPIPTRTARPARSRARIALDRFRLFVDSCGLEAGDPRSLVPAVLHNHLWCYDIVGTAAAHGHAGFSEYWAGGARERAERTRQWYLDNSDLLRKALL